MCRPKGSARLLHELRRRPTGSSEKSPRVTAGQQRHESSPAAGTSNSGRYSQARQMTATISSNGRIPAFSATAISCSHRDQRRCHLERLSASLDSPVPGKEHAFSLEVMLTAELRCIDPAADAGEGRLDRLRETPLLVRWFRRPVGHQGSGANRPDGLKNILREISRGRRAVCSSSSHRVSFPVASSNCNFSFTHKTN